MPVVDASVLVDYLSGSDRAAQTRKRLIEDHEPLWAPHLVDAEVGHVLRRAVNVGELLPSTARAAIDDLAEMPIRRVGHLGLLERAWALRANLTFYDALYVALAERMSMPLLTLDRRLLTVPGIRARVEAL